MAGPAQIGSGAAGGLFVHRVSIPAEKRTTGIRPSSLSGGEGAILIPLMKQKVIQNAAIINASSMLESGKKLVDFTGGVRGKMPGFKSGGEGVGVVKNIVSFLDSMKTGSNLIGDVNSTYKHAVDVTTAAAKKELDKNTDTDFLKAPPALGKKNPGASLVTAKDQFEKFALSVMERENKSLTEQSLEFIEQIDNYEAGQKTQALDKLYAFLEKASPREAAQVQYFDKRNQILSLLEQAGAANSKSSGIHDSYAADYQAEMNQLPDEMTADYSSKLEGIQSNYDPKINAWAESSRAAAANLDVINLAVDRSQLQPYLDSSEIQDGLTADELADVTQAMDSLLLEILGAQAD